MVGGKIGIEKKSERGRLWWRWWLGREEHGGGRDLKEFLERESLF